MSLRDTLRLYNDIDDLQNELEMRELSDRVERELYRRELQQRKQDRELRELQRELDSMIEKASAPHLEASEVAMRRQEFRDFIDTRLEELGYDPDVRQRTDDSEMYDNRLFVYTLLRARWHEPGLDDAEVKALQDEAHRFLDAWMGVSDAEPLAEEQQGHIVETPKRH